MRTKPLSCVAAAVAAFALTAGVASADAAANGRTVFAQTDNTAGNTIVAYDRSSAGTLTEAGSYPTGGLGGTLEGSVVDHLASQSSLVFDRDDDLLFAVNAGSDTVSVFAVFGDRLALRQVISSGGSFPVSVSVSNGTVYVLNALEGGSLSGFRVSGGRLVAIPGSTRALGLNPTATPQFVNTPGQVAFTPAGTQLIVTTKANGSDVDVFGVSAAGRLSRSPVVNSLPGAVPFAVAFDSSGNVVLTEAGTDAVASFQLREDGTLAQLDSIATEQSATCWVVAGGARFYASNAGSGSITGVRSVLGGQLLQPLGRTSTDAGSVDAAVGGERYLYVQTGAAGNIDEFAIEASGALSPIGSVTVPGAVGGEGIVAA
jgi:6-phosphogluconolactonase (cycloisomerase 2 family)